MYPSVVHVAGVITPVYLCPFAGITSCDTKTLSHTEQCKPSVFPSTVHVAFTLTSTTSV